MGEVPVKGNSIDSAIRLALTLNHSDFIIQPVLRRECSQRLSPAGWVRQLLEDEEQRI
jgi:hypothetical protein